VRDTRLHCVFHWKRNFRFLSVENGVKQVLHILPQPSNGQACNYNPRWRHLKPDLSSIPFKKTRPRCWLQVPYCSEKSSFLLTLQAVTSAYEIKLRDSIWSRAHMTKSMFGQEWNLFSHYNNFFFHSPGPD